METRRLEMLVELARRGSMRAVADELGVTTSTVSQQIAALGRETRAVLVEPVGRRVRLTPAGRRLAEHGETILATLEAARLDLDPDADPAGTVRIAGFATAIRRSLIPLVGDLAAAYPKVRLVFHEHEPAESLELLAEDGVDLALVYDFNLAPVTFGREVEAAPLWAARWSLGMPDAAADPGGDAAGVVGRFRDADWIVNSRNTADEDVVRVLASMVGFEPRVAHRADSLDLLQDLVVAGQGVGLLPAGLATRPGVRLLGLADPAVALRAYAVIRRGRGGWAPLRLLLAELRNRRFVATPPV